MLLGKGKNLLVVTLLTIALLVGEWRTNHNGHTQEPLPPAIQGLSPAADPIACRYVKKGSWSAFYKISNPNGISGFRNIRLANFEQQVLARTDTSIDVKITTTGEFTTHAGYPVDSNGLPAEVKGYITAREDGIQSTAPAIVAKTQELVQGATTMVDAVSRIFKWVRGSITYDYSFSLPTDALSVLRNRKGICDGFSNLSVALLRAAGIPAKKEVGCVTQYGWQTDITGGLHAWISIYYPEAGWIGSDPQGTENLLDASHILMGFDQCGKKGTEILMTATDGDMQTIFSYWIPDSESKYRYDAAHIPGMDGIPPQENPLVTTRSTGTIVAIANPETDLSIPVFDNSCFQSGISASTNTPWISLQKVWGEGEGLIQLKINAAGLDLGKYEGEVVVAPLYTEPGYPFPENVIKVQLVVAEHVYQIFLPNVVQN